MPEQRPSSGLLGQGMGTSDGKHLYHETLPPVIAYTAKQEAEARANGYGDDYVFQHYPKVLEDGTVVKSAEEEAALTAEAKPEPKGKKGGAK